MTSTFDVSEPVFRVFGSLVFVWESTKSGPPTRSFRSAWCVLLASAFMILHGRNVWRGVIARSFRWFCLFVVAAGLLVFFSFAFSSFLSCRCCLLSLLL